ncbi:hypothetical protein AVEN_75198-1, partial [Araneus ventricosus]
GVGCAVRKRTKTAFRLIIPKHLQEKKTLLSFISNVGCFGLTQGHAPGKLAARVGVSVGIGISSSDHRRVYPLTCILSVQDILMNSTERL